MNTLDFYTSVSLAELNSIISDATLAKDDLVDFIQEVLVDLSNYLDSEESLAKIIQYALFFCPYEFKEESWTEMTDGDLDYLIRELLEEKSMRGGKQAALNFASSVVNVLPENVQRCTSEPTILTRTKIETLFDNLEGIITDLKKGGVPKENLVTFVTSKYNDTLKTATDFRTELAIEEETLQKILDNLDGLAALKEKM